MLETAITKLIVAVDANTKALNTLIHKLGDAQPINDEIKPEPLKLVEVEEAIQETEEVAVEESQVEEPDITIKDLLVLFESMQAVHRADIMNLMKSYGAKNAKQISPEKLPEVYAKCKTIIESKAA